MVEGDRGPAQELSTRFRAVTRVALYARFSTDKQREASIDDQARVCRARSDREGWIVAVLHSDDGVSGSTPVAARSGGAALLADALAGRFEVLLMEGLDRLSRDSVEQEQIVRRLEHRGIRIIGVSDGYDSNHAGRKLHRGMRGIINEIYLDDLRAKVHRGLDGLVARSLFAGGLPYGYRSIAVRDGHQLEIDQDRAAIVREIFARYADGISPQRIAAELNRRRVPSPRGSTWAASAIYGAPKKGCGILNNVLYTGRYIWNRSQWVKDPDTGKRRRIERPEHEWRKVEAPNLRIVDDVVWRAVRARLQPRPHGTPKRPARTLFSGLLRCGICGGAVVAVSQYDYGCAARKDRGVHVCAGVRAPRRAVEEQLIAHARDRLLADDAIDALQTYTREALRSLQAQRHQGGAATRTRLEQLDREIARLVEAIAACGISEALRARLATAEAERRALNAELAPVAPTMVPDFVPRATERLRAYFADGGTALKRKPEAAREALRELFGSVTIHRRGDDVIAELGGVYAGILAAINDGGQIRHVVAGDRFSNANQVFICRRAA